jgi:hypothetical protein
MSTPRSPQRPWTSTPTCQRQMAAQFVRESADHVVFFTCRPGRAAVPQREHRDDDRVPDNEQLRRCVPRIIA